MHHTFPKRQVARQKNIFTHSQKSARIPAMLGLDAFASARQPRAVRGLCATNTRSSVLSCFLFAAASCGSEHERVTTAQATSLLPFSFLAPPAPTQHLLLLHGNWRTSHRHTKPRRTHPPAADDGDGITSKRLSSISNASSTTKVAANKNRMEMRARHSTACPAHNSKKEAPTIE